MSQTIEDALRLLQMGHAREAEAICRQLLEVAPKDGRTLILSAEVARLLGNRRAARRYLQEVGSSQPFDPNVVHRAALFLCELNDLQGAAPLLRQLTKLHPAAFQFLFDLGQVEEQIGNWQAAVDAYDAASILNSGHPGPFTRRAAILLRRQFGEPGPTPESKKQATGLSKRISMTSLGWNGRFGNQLLQYMFLRLYGEVHGLRVEAPEWLGRWLFELNDPPPSAPLPEYRETGDLLALSLNKKVPQVFAECDLWGYFAYHTSFYRPHRERIRALFQPAPPIKALVDASVARLRERGKTLVAIHLRRGDFGYGRFWIAPEQWYLDWLAEIWPTLEAPVLYIASDDPEIHRQFSAYNPLWVKDLGETVPGVEFYSDFYVLSQADVVAISNSTFSFCATLLNDKVGLFMRPEPKLKRLIPYEPWDAEVSYEPA